MADYLVLNNALRDWALALACTIGGYLVANLAKTMVSRYLSRKAVSQNRSWKEILATVLDQLHPLYLLLAALSVGAGFLKLPKSSERIIAQLFLLASLLQIGLLATRAIRVWFEHYRREKVEKYAEAVTTLSSVSFLLRILLWVLLFLVALDNFGINVTTLIAGLGIGGVAVALAVQNILGDVFASFSIVLDKPFVIGDFIAVDTHMGTVEYIGLKTTRIRSLSGEELIFANDDLLRSRIRNYKRMFERRVAFVISVRYETPLEKIEAIPGIIQEIVKAQSPVRFETAFFKELGPTALNFEVVYWVLKPDGNLYMDIHQAINLAILKRFAQEGIALAFPIQALPPQIQIKGPSKASQPCEAQAAK
jgi:small-conductance mechanosensitive channel